MRLRRQTCSIRRIGIGENFRLLARHKDLQIGLATRALQLDNGKGGAPTRGVVAGIFLLH